MIHNVTIPFSFDTSPIEQQIASIGEDEVRKVVDAVVKRGISEALPTGYYYSKPADGMPNVNWRMYIGDYMDEWMERHKQEVIDEAALLMAMRAGRKKAWREVLAELREDGE